MYLTIMCSTVSVFSFTSIIYASVYNPKYIYVTRHCINTIALYSCSFRNHAFDNPRLYGKKQRKSKRSDVSKPHEVARGCLPVRFHHKSDESKILSTTRLGIDLQSSNQLTF